MFKRLFVGGIGKPSENAQAVVSESGIGKLSPGSPVAMYQSMEDFTMAYTYKKKKYMYQYAKEELKLPVPAMKDCKYTFNSGWEWLNFTSADYVCYKVSFAYGGNFIRIKEYFFDDDWNEHVVRDEIVKGF